MFAGRRTAKSHKWLLLLLLSLLLLLLILMATTQLVQQRTARVKCCRNLIPDWSVYPIKHRYKQPPALNLHRPSTIPHVLLTSS